MFRILLSCLFILVTYHQGISQSDVNDIRLFLKQCDNGNYALMDQNGKQYTACDYQELIKKRNNYCLGRLQDSSIVILNPIGQIISNPISVKEPILEDVYFQLKKLNADKVYHYQVENECFLHYGKTNKTLGPFLPKHKLDKNSLSNVNHRIRNHLNTVKFDYGKVILLRPDSTTVVFDTIGLKLNIEALENISILDDEFYSGKSKNGLTQIRNFEGRLIYEGTHDDINKNKNGFSAWSHDHQMTYEPLTTYLDEEGNTLVENVQYIAPGHHLYSDYGAKLYATKSHQTYALLDSLFNPILKLNNRIISILGEELFSIQDENKETIKVYKGDTTQLVLENIQKLLPLGDGINIVEKDHRKYFYDADYQKIGNTSYQSIERLKNSSAEKNYLYVNDGEIGLLDSTLTKVWTTKGDSLFILWNKSYQNKSLIKDSLRSFRVNEKFGIIDIKKGKAMELKSDDPIFMPKCKDLAIFTKDENYGLYHFPSKIKFPAKYSKISVSNFRDPSHCLDYRIQAILPNGEKEYFFTKGDQIYLQNNLDLEGLGCLQEYRIQRGVRTNLLISKATNTPVFERPGNAMKLIEDDSGEVKYISSWEEEGLIFYDLDFNRLNPEGSNWKMKHRMKKVPLPYFQVTQKTRKITPQDIKTMKENGSDRIFDGTTGLFNFDTVEYTLEMKYDDVRQIGEGLVAVVNYHKIAVANLEGEFLTDFIFHSVDEFIEGYAVAKNLEGQYLIINKKGGNYFNRTFKNAAIVKTKNDSGKENILFSVVENDAKQTSQLIDTRGDIKAELPSGMIYRTLKGPLDVCEKSDQRTVLESVLVQDGTGTELFKADKVVSVKHSDGHYYHAIAGNKQLMLNHAGKVLFTLPFDQSHLNLWKGNGDPLNPDYFCIYHPVKNSIKKASIYTLDGTLLVEDAIQMKNNSFGQHVFMKGDKTYLIPPAN